jgi:fucose 4-O-acetylase-like acetyltransferase
VSFYNIAGFPAQIALGRGSASDILQINTLRGLACLLVVLTHATIEVRIYSAGSVPGVALFNDFTKFVRIPLFTFLSGYVYACRPLVGSDRWTYLRKKSRRLLLPMLFVSLITILARSVVQPGPAAQFLPFLWAAEIIEPSFQLWFVEALFVIFIGLAAGLYRYVFSIRLLLASLLLAFLIDWFGLSQFRQFSVVPALTILPYFLAGALLREARIATTFGVASLATLSLIVIGIWQTLVITGGMIPFPIWYRWRACLPLRCFARDLRRWLSSAVIRWRSSCITPSYSRHWPRDYGEARH